MAKTALEKWREENQKNRTATNAKPNKLEQWQQENRQNAPVREAVPAAPSAPAPSATSMYGSANRTNSNLMDMATRAKLMQAANEMADIKTRQAQALENPRASTAYTRQTEQQPMQDRAKKVADIRKDIDTAPTQSRLGKGVQSVMLSPYASIEYLGESGKQAIKNQKAYEESDLDTKLAEAYTYLMQTERAFGYGSPEYEAAQANYDAVQRELNAFKNAPDKAVDMDSRAAQFMGGVQKLQEEALEGTTGAGRFLGEAALSIGSNLSKLPLNAVVPGASLALMGAEAAAGKAYELGQQGVNAGQALTRGLVSGGIEALTEKVPLDNLVDIIKTGGKVGLMNVLKQAVTEAGEEGVAYLLNLGADKVAGDPEAEFVWNDFWKSVGMGALSGGIMGGGATAINRANAASVGKNYQDVAPELVAEGLQMKQDTDAYRTAAEMQRKLGAGKTLSNVDVGRVVQDNEAAVNTLRQAAMEMAEEQVEKEVQAAMPKRTPVRPIANQQRTAYTESNKTTEGGMTDGEEVHLREGGQRNDRAYPSGEVSRMEESAGRDQSGQDSRLPAKDARAADLRVGEEVSTASLGIGNGASNDRIRVVTGGDTEATTKARAIAKERGLRLTLFTGGNLTINGEECRAYITGDRAFVRADHSDFDADQLMRHEAGHDQIAKGEIDIKAATENIRKRLGGRNNVQRAAQTYASAFAGADMTVEEAIEEIICDSLGDMNVFSDTAVETAFGEVLESAKAAAGESRMESKTGPPSIRVVSKHSRETINIKAATEQESLALVATDPRNVARLQNDVSAVLNNTFPSWRKVLLGKPSEVLAKYMKSDKPLYLPQSAIKKAILLNKEDGGKHGLGRTVIDELPYQLEDPLAITKNTTKQVSVYPDSVVAWTNWQTESGDSIIVPIYVNADGSVGIHNNISTVFDVYDPDYAADLLRPGNVLYTKNGKNIDELLSQQREVLKREQADVSSTDSVAQNIGKSKENLANLGVETDGSSVGKASRESWNRTDKQKLASELMAAGFEKAKVEKWINDVNSISALIAGDPNRLDYDSAPGLSSFVSNAEYGGSFDFSTLCKKRRLLTGTFTAIQKALPDTALTADEILEIRGMMAKADLEVSCGLCYVEGSRANMGQFTQEFIRLYKKYNPGKWAPNMAEMNTPDGIEWVRINHPEVYKEYEYFWNHYGKLRNEDKNLFASQQKPKLYQMRTEYKGEILEHFKRGSSVTEKNRKGGLRLQSFSDFETPHLIDTMQIIMDMADVGLAGQAYTKVPNFAWAFGDTGLKINLSLIAKDVDADGKLVFDEKEGMPIADAMALRERYSENVGTIIVVFTDDQLKAAMADERIDFIIPFHRSQWKKSQYAAMGLPAKTKDYTYQQNEKLIKPTYHEYRGKMVKDKATNYMPNDYWDFSKSGKENAEDYLKMCAANNKRPKFYKLLVNNGDGSYSLQPDGSTDGYWKLLIDFKMYDNDGNGSPQMPVTPEFNMEEANRIMEEYEGGHAQFPVAQGIVDEFLKKKQGKASREANREDVLKAVENLLAEAEAKLDEQELADQMYYGRKAEVQKRNAQEKLERLREQKNERIAQVKAEGREAVKAARIEERVKRDERIAQIEEAHKAELKDTVTAERMAAGREMAAVKQRYKERVEQSRESRSATKRRAQILRHVNKVQQLLLRPTDKNHVPESLRKATASVLSAINTESGFEVMLGNDNKRHRVAEGTAGAEATKRTQAFAALKKSCEEIMKNAEDSIILDPDLLGDSANGIPGLLDQLAELKNKRIADMNNDELDIVWRVLRSIEHSISSAGKVLSAAKYERTAEWADAFVADTASKRSKKGNRLEAMRLDLENPYTFFGHYGEAGKAVFRMLRDAQDEQQLMVENIRGMVQTFVDAKTVESLEKETHDFTTEAGDKLTLNIAQIMEIYLLMKREQAHDHLMKGGIVQPEVKSRKINRGTDAIKLSYNDLTAITKVLTDKQREIANNLQILTTTTLADYGNEASMKVYGYKKFTGTDYWPIKSAGEGIHTNVEKGGNNTRSIKNIGMAKAVMPKASNALDINSVFSTFASHTADMVDYAAWLCPMEDANRLFNFQFRDEDGNKTGKTMKGLLDRFGGKDAQKYWSGLMEDIQNGIKAQSDTAILQPVNKMIGNVRGASVGANLRVIVQQPTAILRASAVLTPEAMFRGMFIGGGWKTALEHSPVAMRKDMGGFDISSPMQMNEILFDNKTKLQRVNEFFMAGAGKADAITWGRIWNACESEVAWDNKNLKPGTDEFYEKVSELFTEVIDQSQVVDGVLQRSRAMRSSNTFVQQATAFMGEPTMALNMMLRAYDNFASETDGKKRTAARKAFGKTAMALVLTNAINALAQSLVDALRDDSDEEYTAKVLNAFTGITDEETAWEKATAAVLSGNFGSSLNPVGYVPFAKDILSVLQGYNVTRADADVVGDIISSVKTFSDSISGDGKRSIAYATKNLAQQVSKVFGVSAANLLRDAWGIARTIAQETGSIELQYEMEKAIYKLNNDGNTSRFTKLLYKAYNADEEAYNHIYADMESAGVDMEKVRKQMEKLLKEEQGVTDVNDLDSRYLNPTLQKTYDSAMQTVRDNKLWDKATEEQQDKVEDILYELTVGSATGKKMQEKIDGGKAAGIDTADFLLYKLAMEMYDQPTENGKYGTYTQEEVEGAIKSIAGLSSAERRYFWTVAGKKEDKSPW